MEKCTLKTLQLGQKSNSTNCVFYCIFTTSLTWPWYGYFISSDMIIKLCITCALNFLFLLISLYFLFTLAAEPSMSVFADLICGIIFEIRMALRCACKLQFLAFIFVGCKCWFLSYKIRYHAQKSREEQR